MHRTSVIPLHTHIDTVDDKITGKKRMLVISSSSNKPATKRVKKSTSSHENESGLFQVKFVC